MAGHGKNRILHGDLLRSVLTPLLEDVGTSDRSRLKQILDMAVAEKIQLSACLGVLFPDQDQAKAVKALTNLRSRFNHLTEENGIELRFVVDSRKRNAPSERSCWFVGADPAFAQAEKFSDELTADIVGDPLVPARGIVTTGSALAANKRVVRFFISYAHEDTDLAEKLIKEFRAQFKPSRRYELQLWIDRDIMLGERWHEQIQSTIAACDFGLLLLSPAFLGSDYIGEHELPHFVGKISSGKKPVIPIGLVRVDFGTHDLKGLSEHQVFLKGRRFFAGLRAAEDKRQFVHELYLEVEKRLNQWFGATTGIQLRVDLLEHVPVPDQTRDFQRTRGLATTLAGLATLDGKTPQHDQARDALDELEAWTTAADEPFFALLGEYGIGKTTTLKQFTRQLLDKLKDPQAARTDLPLPIFVDLRDYVGERKDQVPTIEELLDEVLRRSWKLSDRAITAKDLLRLVREEGALIIFDGLDEKIVHLTADKARAFIRTLWAVLPDASRGMSKAPAPAGTRRGKMILSCRSHYFHDIMSQNAMLVGEDREGLDAKSYPALCLLPFTEDQIRGYLASFLRSPERAGAAFDLIGRIHNLPELAQRPYLLALITSRLEELETLGVRGETVNAARLYDLFVRSWLNRDDGKHQLNPTHKRRLMEDLAAAMWREGAKQWDVDRLESWLDDFLAADENRALAGAYYTKDRDVLKEDLRTATFVLRPDAEEKHFRFAHTSLQEFFLAAYLARALRERASQRWDLPLPSIETLDFLGQILAWERSAVELETLNSILGDYCLRAATIAFRYWLTALEKDLPAPQPPHVRLAGADLEEWQLRGPSQAQLALRGANLAGARLNRARLETIDLTGADLTGLEARQALFLDVQASGAKAARADFAGLQWRGGSLARSDLSNACLAGCQWIDVDLLATTLPEDWTRQAYAVNLACPQQRIPDAALLAVIGHGNCVTSCAWSPEGKRLASGSEDATVSVWDAAGGQCLLTLRGHQGPVDSCAWSPDGTRLSSGSGDNTVKVWDAADGQCLLTLRGHQGPVMSCAWSPDRMRLATCSGDNTVKVWDAADGQCLLTFQEGSVMSCAWSPDGTRLATASALATVRVWDAAGGQCLLTVQGHQGPVMSCAWSPAGTRLASASHDDTVRVWDAVSGGCLLTLKDHQNVVMSCAWSPDGTRLATASADKTVRVWEAASGRCFLTLKGHQDSVRSCVWSPDAMRLASGSADKTVKVWEAASGKHLLTLHGHQEWVRSCAWSSDGTRLACGSDDNTIKVWDAASGRCLRTLQGHQHRVMSCTWSPDGTRLASGSWDNTVRVWDVASGHGFLIFQAHQGSVRSCAWSPDGTRLASGSHDTMVKVWDAANGQCLLTLEGHQDSVNSCVWSPDGTRLASGSHNTMVKVWDAANGQCLLTLEGHQDSVNSCAWSPDGTRLASGSWDQTGRVWDAASGQCLLTLEGHQGPVMSCVWSPDGAQLASGSGDTVKLWDAASGRCLRTLQGHQGPVTSCAWSPNGMRLVSGSADATVKMWDAVSGICLWTGHLFPELQVATIDGATGNVTHASPEAWRFLGWRWFDPDLGRHRLLPAETFGPLPFVK
jgi:WD40 repeat protein/uncharacterized protein YjbI with pentapeptide repeats